MTSWRIKITDDPDALYKPIAERYDISIEDVRDWTYLLYGSGHDIGEKLKRLKEDYCINYILVAGRSIDEIERFAKEVIRPLLKIKKSYNPTMKKHTQALVQVSARAIGTSANTKMKSVSR